mmetsp:Transcript_18028/g.12969  ORF Transcript_18028/g.12969 Transcript_18028/m.12969 type:complete len:92 (+) Transcript_18028:800-1075(+)
MSRISLQIISTTQLSNSFDGCNNCSITDLLSLVEYFLFGHRSETIFIFFKVSLILVFVGMYISTVKASFDHDFLGLFHIIREYLIDISTLA